MNTCITYRFISNKDTDLKIKFQKLFVNYFECVCNIMNSNIGNYLNTISISYQ